MTAPHRPRILVISQVYVPDPAAVGQYMADASRELVKRGYDVRVLTSGRGYADPSQRFPAHEIIDGVEVVRLPFSSFGKKTILHRLLGQSLFLLQVMLRGLFTGRLATVLVSTSPPMASVAALVIRFFRRVPMKFWLMDLNPDQVVASGKFAEGSLPVRLFDWLNRRLLGASSEIIVLDRFMAERLIAKRDVREKITVIPPWPMEDDLQEVQREDNPFIEKHGLSDKTVVMYSGNHAITSPVETFLAAALKLADHPRLHFMFIGGGHGKAAVDAALAEQQPPNATTLAYQPLSEIKYSLSAADVHIVSLSDNMVGITHPCKVYGAMTLSRPFLFFGPQPSHVSELLETELLETELLEQAQIGWHVANGDVEGAVAVLEKIDKMSRQELREMGQNAGRLIHEEYSREKLCGEFCDIIVRGLPEA
ncbi:glycosyltransferase family 4 protein [Adhaeretor mobilis]|uniref:Putative glycosyl transferase n=1 Tax=Adhaeretor mobilis TaxID=1930276 RepID=A0A517MRZ5_9BACT|nr:glycosyltransferase family 4 protein [Adhaeretor mobilis]QDS97653.1 putative glycosyl transferase [Adhaeretor mobilis]